MQKIGGWKLNWKEKNEEVGEGEGKVKRKMETSKKGDKGIGGEK